MILLSIFKSILFILMMFIFINWNKKSVTTYAFAF